ncbi:MAG: hypothetical protein COC15_02275 [Legionellales bacterium]|nr:MAG: hypothetical protein COC15_02275 [Legionellales bacterium]
MSLNIAKTVVLATTIAAVSGAAAFVENSYMGVGFGNSWMNTQSKLKPLVAKSYPQTNIFAGMRFNDMFAVELGYTLSSAKSKSSTVKVKDLSDDKDFDKTDEISITSKTKVQGYTLDVLGYMPMNDCVEFFGIVGLGLKKATVELYPTAFNKGAVSTVIAKTFASAKGKRKVTLRFGGGAAFMFTEELGMRAKLVYETTGRVRVQGDENYREMFGNKFFKDSYTAGVDFFFKF